MCVSMCVCICAICAVNILVICPEETNKNENKLQRKKKTTHHNTTTATEKARRHERRTELSFVQYLNLHRKLHHHHKTIYDKQNKKQIQKKLCLS